MRSRSLLPFALAVALFGCYHATIDTGAKPSTLTVEKHWASGWIFGLVPPSTVETAAKCPSGVSRVETQLSFVNMLVSFLTLSIYTPMDIRVTCAEGTAGTTSFAVPDSASAVSWQAAIAKAASESQASGQPVYLTVVH